MYKQQTTLGDTDSVENFSAKYIVDKKYVVSALEHLQLIELKKKKKQQADLLQKNRIIKYEDIAWGEYVEESKLRKLKVKSSNLYLP